MVVLSTLCRAKNIFNVANKPSIFKLFSRNEPNAFKQAVRNMSEDGGKRIFHITPTRYQYTRFKDDLHFYIFIGVVPLGLLILYVNIFIGPATLTEIPDDYEPRHWEYYKHPIKRWFSKTFFEDEQVMYEQRLHALHEEKEKHDWRETCRKVVRLQVERDDYKGYNFIPADEGRTYRYTRKIVDDLDENRGYK